MIYKGKELPVQLKAGDIIAYRNEFQLLKPMTYLSTAIRFFTQCPYNHSATVVEFNGELYVNEAVAGGIISRPLNRFLERDKSSIAILRSKEPIEAIKYSNRAGLLQGVKYDFTSLVFHQTVYRIPKLLGFKKFGKWVGSTGTFAEGKMVCSEYCAYLHNLKNWWLMSTAELLEHPSLRLVYEEKPLL